MPIQTTLSNQVAEASALRQTRRMQPAETVFKLDIAEPAQLRWQVQCPVCATSNVERDPFMDDDASVRLNPDKDEYASPIYTRGGFVEVSLACEVGHGFKIIVANHKGAEFVGVVVPPEE